MPEKSIEHTPGPWSYYHDTCASCEKSGTKEFVIVGPPGGNHGQFSNEADAELIAAAPDLLQACQAAFVALPRAKHNEPINEMLQAAIIKAGYTP